MTINAEGKKHFAEWLKTRPQCVQDFANKHPLEPGDMVQVNGETMHFMGYGEYENDEVGLIVTPIDPSVDYDGAIAASQNICADHFDQPGDGK